MPHAVGVFASNVYNWLMTIRLTPDQESIAQQAVKNGLATSVEEFVTVALRQMRAELTPDLEARLGMSTDDINRELDKGLAGDAKPWEGAATFHENMLKKYLDRSLGRSTK